MAQAIVPILDSIDSALTGVGGASQLLLSHTTVRTGPYTAVRCIERAPVPAGRMPRGLEACIRG